MEREETPKPDSHCSAENEEKRKQKENRRNLAERRGGNENWIPRRCEDSSVTLNTERSLDPWTFESLFQTGFLTHTWVVLRPIVSERSCNIAGSVKYYLLLSIFLFSKIEARRSSGKLKELTYTGLSLPFLLQICIMKSYSESRAFYEISMLASGLFDPTEMLNTNRLRTMDM